MTFKFANSPSKSNFPLLTEIDEQVHGNSVEWNKNAFLTLLTSNLPPTTILYYAVDVGLRRLENSLYEAYWDVTADALNDLSQYLLNQPLTSAVDAYLYEAKCQLLMYSAIAIIKLNTIRRHSANDAKMACATICSLLFQQSKSYEPSKINHEYSACLRSMHSRFLTRTFIAGQWLPTLSQKQLGNIQSDYQRFISLLVDHLFPAMSLREKINAFIDGSLMESNTGGNDDDETISTGFTVIPRFPRFQDKLLDKQADLMAIALVNTLNQLKKDISRRLICCIWTLSCMIEADRLSLEILNSSVTCEHFSLAPIDFEQIPNNTRSLNDRDVMVFLLLCAQQNVHLYGGDSTLHPYLLFSSTNLCTQHQKNWWQSALEQTPMTDFVNNLSTIRLVDQSVQYLPTVVILETARLLFKTARRLYEEHARRSASSYEQYALQYLQVAKTNKPTTSDSMNKKQEKLFFFQSQKTGNTTVEETRKLVEQLTDECEKIARKCDELKLLPEPEPPRTSSPTKQSQDQKDLHLAAAILSPVVVVVEKEPEQYHPSEQTADSTFFATPPSNKTRDSNVRSSEPSPLPTEQVVEPLAPPSFPPFVDMIFTHMNGVNQWINKFCAVNAGIQNDINTIRDRLEKLNQTTNQMLFSNVRMFQSDGTSRGNAHPPPPAHE